MSQSDILDLLKKHPYKWFTSYEISVLIKVKPASVSMNCKRMRKHKVVEFKITKLGDGRLLEQYVYKHKELKKND